MWPSLSFTFRYIFTSKADEEKHTKLIHGGVRALRDANQDKASHRCPVCDQKYPTRYRLLKHQDEEGHKLKKADQGRTEHRENNVK